MGWVVEGFSHRVWVGASNRGWRGLFGGCLGAGAGPRPPRLLVEVLVLGSTGGCSGSVAHEGILKVGSNVTCGMQRSLCADAQYCHGMRIVRFAESFITSVFHILCKTLSIMDCK